LTLAVAGILLLPGHCCDMLRGMVVLGLIPLVAELLAIMAPARS
jgi:hypothetical protein